LSVKIFRGPSDEDVVFDIDLDIPSDLISISEDREKFPSDTTFFGEVRIMAQIENIDFSEKTILRVRAYRGEDEVRLGSIIVNLISNREPSSVKQ